jgi:hypothetical protein
MQVTCPHCSKAFQAERSGTQYCPNCGNQLDVPVFAEGSGPQVPQTSGWSPQASVEPGAAVTARTPWERRADLGVWQGLWQTWKMSMFSPQAFWGTVDPQASATEALWYAWILGAVTAILTLPFSYLSQGQIQAMLQNVASQNTMPPETLNQIIGMLDKAGPVFIVGATLGSVLFIPVFLASTAAFIHLCGLITGAAGQGFNATFRVVCYSSSPTLFSFHSVLAIPATVYRYILMGFGLQTVHRTTSGKVIFALVLPLLVCCVCCCVGGILFGAVAGAAAAKGH